MFLILSPNLNQETCSAEHRIFRGISILSFVLTWKYNQLWKSRTMVTSRLCNGDHKSAFESSDFLLLEIYVGDTIEMT